VVEALLQLLVLENIANQIRNHIVHKLLLHSELWM
jgi:hypothetical protein